MSSSRHSCLLTERKESQSVFGSKKRCATLRKHFLISSSNPLTWEFFRSASALKAEKRRQVQTDSTSVIHPMSKFRMWYDLYLILVYVTNLVGKPLDSAFASEKSLYPGYRLVAFVLDFCCWLDIIVNFNTGFVVKDKHYIELRRGRIAKKYVYSPYFICDFVSSVPRTLPYAFASRPPKVVLGFINIFGMLKFIRIFSVVSLINKVWRYFQFKSTMTRFTISSLLVTSLLIHWLSCMQFIVPRLTGRFFFDPNNPYEESWIYNHGIYQKSLRLKYAHCFFKGKLDMKNNRYWTRGHQCGVIYTLPATLYDVRTNKIEILCAMLPSFRNFLPTVLTLLYQTHVTFWLYRPDYCANSGVGICRPLQIQTCQNSPRMSSSRHSCLLTGRKESQSVFGSKKCCATLRKHFLISSSNPLTWEFFRSASALKAEKRRQVQTDSTSVIHPMSKFRMWYDLYLILVYVTNLVGKPLDSAFASEKSLYPGYRLVSVVLDLCCWLDIIVNFNTGFVVKDKHYIELRRGRIAKKYVYSAYFICDFVSSVPRILPYLVTSRPSKVLLGFINIFGLLKFIRIFSVVSLINKVWRYFQFKSTTIRFMISSLLVTSLLIHWLSCMQFIVPRLTGRFFFDPNNPFEESWIYNHGIYHKSLKLKYAHCFFKGSSEILGMRLDMYPINITADYVVSICTYWIGKIIMVSIWVILSVAMLNARSMELKFYEVVNQLDAYMTQRRLPLNLREKLSRYYDFKYQRQFFKEQMITNLLSPNLKREVHIHVCKSLIAGVKLFAEMTPEQVNLLVIKLIPEIFLPKDTIIQAGTLSEAMYFVSSGTVVVYSRSGKEICHLQNGEYFGEVSMVLKNQLAIATVVALETTIIYRLRKSDFEFCIRKDKKLFDRLVTDAEKWLKTINQIEDEYRRKLFEQTYATAGSGPDVTASVKSEEN